MLTLVTFAPATVSCTWTGPHIVWATVPVTVEVVGLGLGLGLLLLPELGLLPDPEDEDPLLPPEPLPLPPAEPPLDEPADGVPELPPERVVGMAVTAEPRCEASKPRSSTNAETVLSTQ